MRNSNMSLVTAHIPKEEVFLAGSGDGISAVAIAASAEQKVRLRHEVLQKDLDLLRARLDIIRTQAGVVARSGATWAHASAREQLGPYPWAKFAALAVVPYLMTRVFRNGPIGSIAAAVVPLISAAVKNRRQ
jgi:hypothetical protein